MEVPALTLPVLARTLFVAAMPVPASPSGGQSGQPGSRSPSGSRRAGTGDVFASVIAADAINDIPFEESVKTAASFVAKAIKKSDEMGIPAQDGVCFELFMNDLIQQ